MGEEPPGPVCLEGKRGGGFPAGKNPSQGGGGQSLQPYLCRPLSWRDEGRGGAAPVRLLQRQDVDGSLGHVPQGRIEGHRRVKEQRGWGALHPITHHVQVLAGKTAEWLIRRGLSRLQSSEAAGMGERQGGVGTTPVGPLASSQEQTPGTPSPPFSWNVGTAEDKVWDTPPGAQCDVLTPKCPCSTWNGFDRVEPHLSGDSQSSRPSPGFHHIPENPWSNSGSPECHTHSRGYLEESLLSRMSHIFLETSRAIPVFQDVTHSRGYLEQPHPLLGCHTSSACPDTTDGNGQALRAPPSALPAEGRGWDLFWLLRGFDTRVRFL